MFLDARRSAGAATEARGTLLPRTSACRWTGVPEVVAGITALAARHDLEIPVVAHAGDGNLHPLHHLPARRRRADRRARSAFDELMALAPTSAARSPVSTASAGSRRRAPRPGRARRHGAPAGQGGARSPGHAQPRRRVRPLRVRPAAAP